MTEQEWLTCADPQLMLEFLKGRASDRKLRLFAVACCCRMWYLLPEWGRCAVEVAEQFADGVVDQDGLASARRDLPCAPPRYIGAPLSRQYYIWLAVARTLALEVTPKEVAGYAAAALLREEEPATQCFWLREIVGNPFRPVFFPAAWQTATAVNVARAIYHDRNFTDTPVLADALEDAGCTDADVLGHLRGSRRHARGCFVLDLILGRS